MGPYRAFLTGEPGCGKTTVIVRICERLEAMGLKHGGVISREIRRGGVRVGFSLEDLLTHEMGILAHVDQRYGPRVGKYRVNLGDVDRVGASAITRTAQDADVVIVDEIGPMELHSMQFIQAVRSALSSGKHCIGTIHKHATHSLVTDIKSNSEIIEVTHDNRDRLPVTMVEYLSRQT